MHARQCHYRQTLEYWTAFRKILLYAGPPAPSPLNGWITLDDVLKYLCEDDQFHSKYSGMFILVCISLRDLISTFCFSMYFHFRIFSVYYQHKYVQIFIFTYVLYRGLDQICQKWSAVKFLNIFIFFLFSKLSSTWWSHILCSDHLYEKPLKYVKEICHKIQ